MRRLFTNILSLDPQNISAMILWIAAALWVGVWLVLVVDVFKKTRSGFWKFFWLLFTAIPVAGGMVYSLNELLFSDWKGAFSWRQHEIKSKASKRSKKT